ncbi:hypothetical protein FNV43_RR10083 [Rhamnella rubrinervis]|uniref:ADP-ribosyl cyclase/cyclic ADP-ribose hydrolase n=1 Tax=Rhamnella rubrinervis TaxID=2594499 RepID=A0A8K0HCG9_9ROSA|nr:hypothetical protein FNV43_RR10083 [Rhamnella rubrinervis]
MAGIGKTALASAIFQKLYRHFEGSCFLENVRHASEGHRLRELRNKLLTELYKDRPNLSLDTPSVVPPFISDRFRRKRVIIVLDDVGCSSDVDALIKGYEDFSPDSRIIVTSRDAQVLKNVTDQIYMVDVLDYSESLSLFQLHAFQKKHPSTDYTELSQRVAYYADGNPLALTLLGKMLHSRSIDEWKSALKMLEMNPDIQNVLRISYKGLTNMQKDIFLDIACFFAYSYYNKFKREVVESILDDKGSSSAKIGISVLNDKSLITIGGDYKVISMHNLLQQMGLELVCEEHEEPGNRSRLWMPKDISHVLETASGTEKIKSITLHLCDLEKDVKVSHAAFSKMSNLQYFQIVSHENSKFRLLPDHEHGLEIFPSNKLRYFCWEFYPYECFPSGFIPENLVRLTLTDSQLVKFWNEDQPAPALEKLKFLELHGSKKLILIPNLSRAINIERICLARCISLVQLPSYFKDLHKLQFLNLTGCSNLKVEGVLAGEKLRELYLAGTAIVEVPSSIGCLSDLLVLDLHDCTKLKIVPTSICKFKSLESLDLSGCLKLEDFPEILEPMECLQHISLRGTMIKELPQSSFENLNALSELDLSWCKNIEFLLSNLCCLRNIEKLVRLNVSSCENLESIPELPPSLTHLDARLCKNLKSIQKLPPSLTSLDASDCMLLEKISSWRTPVIQELSCFLCMSCSYRFDNCQKLDQNTRNYIIPRGASVEILSVARSTRKWESKCDHGLSMVFCYPGDDIPDYFKSHDSGTTINIDLRPNWCDANFLGFALCFVLDLSDQIGSEILFDHIKIECVFSFMNDDGDVEYPCKVPVKWFLKCSKLNSDHVLMLYDNNLSCKMLQENFGANWSSIRSSIVTKASFNFRLSLHSVDGTKSSGFLKSDGWSIVLCHHRCRRIIKKCGVWFVYEDKFGEKLKDVEQPEEETKRFAQFSLVSGASTSREVVCPEDEKVKTNTEEDESYPNTSAQDEPSYTAWLPYIC